MPETHFGYRQVPLTDKQALVDDVFHKVARRYDLMNDLMSAGLHRAWKDALVTAINPPTKGRPGRLEETKGRPGRLDEKPDRDFALLDVAGGTGDVSFRTRAATTPSPSSMRMPSSCRSRTRALTPCRSRSASATCRASMWLWAKCAAC
jgi:demethylmenaquinone methyltransferase/2-methoxy-6-polyprenyl-1,4-benzoquinol methylase